MKAPISELDVFLEACPTPVGRLTGFDDGAISFRYLTDDIPHPLSLSLPMREEPFRDLITRSFFGNLLFENAQRDQVMRRYRLDYSDVVGQLKHIGADCPGAISCVPVGSGPPKIPGNLLTDYEVLDHTDLEEIMVSLRDYRWVPDDMRAPSPLAGVQGKIALAQLPDGRFALPKRGLNVPTTHILKVPGPGEMATVEHEHLLMQIMAEVQKHPVATTQPIGEGDLRGLLVTRFDRKVIGSTVHRVHQEDFAQALGLASPLKYERSASGTHRFSAEAAGQVLAETARPGPARQAFLEVTLANLALGNTDNHAKNHALLYIDHRPVFAPVYDVAPILINDQITHQMAFAIGNARMTQEITPDDIDAFIRALGFPRVTPALLSRLRALVRLVVARIPGLSCPMFKPIGYAMAEQTGFLAASLSLELPTSVADVINLNRP